MASPVGHSLVGVSLYCAFGGSVERSKIMPMMACMFVACLPDLDYVPGLLRGDLNFYHQGPSHSIAGAVVALGLGVWMGPWLGMGRLRAASMASLLFISHLVVDCFTLDLSPPFGIPFLWPLSSARIAVPAKFCLLLPPEKSSLGSLFCLWNVAVIGVELAVFVPLTVVMCRWGSRRSIRLV